MFRLGGLCVMMLAPLLSTGCGSSRPPLIKVVGKVTLDGQPLEGAQVALQPITVDPKEEFQRPSSGVTNAAGEFVPQTYVEGDGLRLGKYRVAIVKRETVGQIPAGMHPEQAHQLRLKQKWITPRAAATPESSGIEVEVTSSGLSPELISLTSVRPAEIE